MNEAEIRAKIHAEREAYPRTRVKVNYNVILRHGPGAMSEPYQTEKDGPYERSDMHAWGPHPFSSGFPTLESTADTVKRAQEWGDQHAAGAQVWVEKITETTFVERVS